MSSLIDTALQTPHAWSLARKVVEAMEREKVWPTSVNYALWLQALMEPKGEAATALRSAITTDGFLSESASEALAARCLPARPEADPAPPAESSRRLASEFDGAAAALAEALQTSTAYEQTLAATAGRLGGPVKAAELPALLAGVAAETRQVADRNDNLQKRLQDSLAEIEELRRGVMQGARDALTDGLTGLPNRKSFDQSLQRACVRAEREGRPLALAMLDVDHFKRFNDTWGHQTGDQILRHVALVVEHASAAPAVAFRFGGEEFAVIYPGQSAGDACPQVDAVREAISSAKLKRREKNIDLGVITLSAGLADWKPGEPPEALIERADRALYRAKAAGRDRTIQAAA
jgi:diguanylate cyclase